MIRIIVASSLVVSPLNISVSLNKFLCSSLLCSKVAISTATVHSIKLQVYFWHLNIDLEMYLIKDKFNSLRQLCTVI